MRNASPTASPFSVIDVGPRAIPIQNIYYLLCYAWEVLPEAGLVEVSANDELSLPDLLARVLAGAVRHLLKRGLDRAYLVVEEEIAGVRGKIDLSGSLKHASKLRGKARCVFDELSVDVLHNQIVKTTLRRLAEAKGLDGELSDLLRELYRRMPEVREIGVSDLSSRRVVLVRNSAHYRFVLDVCELVNRNLLANETSGEVTFRDFVRDDAQMAVLFERFLFRFFKVEQRQFAVRTRHLTWLAAGTDADVEFLPTMRTDIVLSDETQTIVVDAKYYAEALGEHFGKSSLRSGHLYQMHAYMNHVAPQRDAGRVRGMLIYPRVTKSVRVNVTLSGHPFTAITIDLTQPWQAIRSGLLDSLT
jgi:5-methylcytosine-specific restriction enzyme subunit McrC